LHFRKGFPLEIEPVIFDTKDFQSFPFRLSNRRRYSASERMTDSIPAFLLGFLGLPLLIGLAMMPFWDRIGDWQFVASINNMLAPAIDKLPNLHQHSLTQRRFMIGASVLLYALFLGELIVLLVSKKRRFLYLEYYDIRKGRFYIALILSMLGMAFCWYVVFVNESWTRFPASGKFLGGLIIWLPLATVQAARMSAIALMGVVRDARHLSRHFR
jgi:hypothetical protein